MSTDEYFMKQAIKLALKANGQASPNPLVGAVIVKDNQVIAKGFHHRAGLAHAETIALDKAKGKARGAKLYLNLEPCCHFGRTPPCVYAIMESGIKEVIIGAIDPNPMMSGRSVKLLRAHNVKVKTGILEKECQDINQPFMKYISKKMPYVTVKVAQSLDGKIATRSGQSKWITQEPARKYSHDIRRFYDAILVGINTVLNDNPLLNAKLTPHKRYFKVIIDPQLKIPLKARIFSAESKGEVLIATSCNAPKLKKMQLEKIGVKVFTFAPEKGRILLKDLLRRLAELEISSILVEGGGETIGRFFDEKQADAVLFFSAPKIIGGVSALSSVMGRGIAKVSQSIQIKELSFKKIGQDLLVRGYVHRYS